MAENACWKSRRHVNAGTLPVPAFPSEGALFRSLAEAKTLFQRAADLRRYVTDYVSKQEMEKQRKVPNYRMYR